MSKCCDGGLAAVLDYGHEVGGAPDLVSLPSICSLQIQPVS
jgi:hypothetical protein